MFIASLPSEDAKDSVDTLKIVKILREERETELSSTPLRVSEFPSALFMETVAREELRTELKNYSSWIKNRVPEVEEAADALRAYNELLNHELAQLYKDFFKKTAPNAELYLGEVAYDDWPNVLTEQSYSAIDRASVQSVLLRPLGVPIAAREPSSGEKPPEAEPVGPGVPRPPSKDRDTADKKDAELGRRVRRLLRGQARKPAPDNRSTSDADATHG
jgi:hypothetical protein